MSACSFAGRWRAGRAGIAPESRRDRTGPHRDRTGAIESGRGSVSCACGVLAAESSTARMPRRSHRMWIFEPGLRRATGVCRGRPGLARSVPALQCAGADRVEHRSGSVNLGGHVEPPAAAGLNQMDDRGQRRPVAGSPLATTLRPTCRHRDQRLGDLPEVVRRAQVRIMASPASATNRRSCPRSSLTI